MPARQVLQVFLESARARGATPAREWGIGITCFVVQSTLADARVKLSDIFIGAIPFTFVMLLVTVLLIAVPRLSLLFL